MGEKLIKIAKFNKRINDVLGTDFAEFEIFRSKGLISHLINRKHFVAAKYIDFLPEIIAAPDFVGVTGGNIELVKVYKDTIFISVKLDEKHNRYYVATMFEAKAGKIEAYVQSGRLKRYDYNRNGS